MSLEITELFAEREAERYALHTRYLNEQMVRVLKTIGFDKGFRKGAGQYLYDRQGDKYLDLLSGWGVFAIGRNHPTVRDALKQVLDSDFPNLVQMDVSALAGVLAERLLRYVPYLDKVFFANSGTEAVEAGLKFARAATGRAGIVYCGHAFHGLSYGALSVNGDGIFRDGFGPLLPECTEIPFNDLDALDRALSTRQVAAFLVEPIQGKGVVIPLFKDHKVLTQVAGHANHTIKLLPPLTITDADCDWIERAFKVVIADAHRVPGAIWTLGKTLVDNAVRTRAAG